MCTELEHSHRGWTQISYKNILSECDSGICFDLSCFLFVIDFPPTERGRFGKTEYPEMAWLVVAKRIYARNWGICFGG